MISLKLIVFIYVTILFSLDHWHCLNAELTSQTHEQCSDQSNADDGQCSKGKDKESVAHEKKKYTTKDSWLKYLASIEQAVVSYQNCTPEKLSCYKKQMKDDFKFWKDRGGIHKSDFEYAKMQHLGEHYQIINHRLYREENCIFPFRCSGNEHFILKVIKKLPDMELIINTHDWPKVSKYFDPAPVLSFSKTSNERDILYPAWSFWEGGPAIWPIYPTGLGRWDLHREEIVKTSEVWPWGRKEKIAFFRGSRTSSERDPLILLSRSDPTLVDAQYTKNQAWRSDADTLHAPPAKEIPLEDHCKYRYLFNLRGVAASFRLKYLFLCNSLVFNVKDDWIEFFYPALKPWVHYIPVSADFSDAKDLIEFARAHDDVVQAIADRGKQFILENLRMQDVENYWKRLLLTYGKMTKWKPQRDKSLKEILPKKESE